MVQVSLKVYPNQAPILIARAHGNTEHLAERVSVIVDFKSLKNLHINVCMSYAKGVNVRRGMLFNIITSPICYRDQNCALGAIVYFVIKVLVDCINAQFNCPQYVICPYQGRAHIPYSSILNYIPEQ